ncbi:unnamed protein product, partial [Linum tenue]
FSHLSSSPYALKPYSTSSAAVSLSSDLPKPSSLSARISFLSDQIDAIERERAEKHETLQNIRTWRRSKTDNQQLQNQELREEPSFRKPEVVVVTTVSSSHDEESDAGYGFDVSSSGSGVELGTVLHPWPEWIELMQRLALQNYFDHQSTEEDEMVESLGIDDGFEDVKASVEKNEKGIDFAKDFRTVQNAFVNFGKDRFDILRLVSVPFCCFSFSLMMSLSRKDLQLLVGYGCPTADRRVVMSAKLLRKHVHLNEDDVCSSCSLRSSCGKAFLLTNKEEEAHTNDVLRVLLAYGSDRTNESVTNKPILEENSVKTVVRKLFHEIVKLSADPINPNLPPPVIKKPPPKVKQPPPPPKVQVGRDDIEMKKGDWRLKCDFMNFTKNTACLQCDAKSPKRELLPEERECPQCNLNYRRNMVCLHCDCKRPHEEFLENRMEERNREQKTRFEKDATRPEVSNAWNFNLNDDESDGADVAAFENADSVLNDHEPPMSAAPAQGGNFRDREMGARNPSRYSNSQPSRSGTGITLTHQIVHSTLLNCSSDLIALSFFIWSAKQPNHFHDRRAFDHMVGVVWRLSTKYHVKGIVRELENIGIATKAPTFLLLLRVYWCGGMYTMVLEAFKQMCYFGFTPNTFAYNVIVDISFRMGQTPVGMKALKDVPSPNFLSYNIALCHVCKSNDLVHIKDVLCRMVRKGYYPTAQTFETVLNCFCRVGNLGGAFQVLGLMVVLGASLSVMIWTKLIGGFFNLGEPVKAGFLFKKMVETGCSPNVVTYTTLFRGYVESGMVDGAFTVLTAMESGGLAPDLVLCNVLMHSLIKIGREDDAASVFVSMLKWNLVPDSFTMCSLLSTQGSSRNFLLWLKLLARFIMLDDPALYNSLIHCGCYAGYPFLAEWFYEDMVEKGFMPDNYSFAGLLRALCAQGRSDKAVNVYLGLLRTGHDLNAHVHTVIMVCLIQSGDFDRAIKLFREAVVQKYPLDDVSYTVVIRGLFERGRTEEAINLYDKMKSVNLSPNVHTYKVMLHGLSVRRDRERIEKLLEDIVEAKVLLDEEMQ